MGFAKQRERMTDAIYRRLGEPSTWTGVPDPVLVIDNEQDESLEFGQSVRIERSRFVRVRKKEVASPQAGDIVALDSGISYQVMGEPELQRHLVWQCEVTLI